MFLFYDSTHLFRMLIQDYFKNIQSYKLSDAQKNRLYERILSKTQNTSRTNIFTRTSFFSKVVWYAVLLILIGLSIYIPYLWQNHTNDSQNGAVLADYIANIVQAKGAFSITSDWRKIDWNNIRNGDTIVLASGGSLVFHVNEQIEGKITWPASFVIYRQGSGYAISMIQGDYIEVSTISETTPELAVISSNNKVTTKSKAGDKYHFVVSTKNDTQLVLNKASNDISVTSSESPSWPKTTLVAWKSSVIVGPEGNITLAENQLFATTKAKQDNSAPITKEEDSYENSFFNELLATTVSPKETNESKISMVARTIWDASSDLKEGESNDKPISTIDRKSLRNNLLPQFVWVDLKYLTYYYLNWQQLEYQRSFDAFLQRIQRTYTALGVPIPTIAEINNDSNNPFLMSNLMHLVWHLAKNLPSDMPENDKNTISTIAVFLTKLSVHSFGAFAEEWLYLEDMFEKIK